jgi:hypothetical protein
VGLELGPLSLVSTVEELLGRNSSGSGLESQEYGCGDPLCSPRDTPLSSNVGTNFADKRSLWLGIVHLRTEATEFVCFGVHCSNGQTFQV